MCGALHAYLIHFLDTAKSTHDVVATKKVSGDHSDSHGVHWWRPAEIIVNFTPWMR